MRKTLLSLALLLIFAGPAAAQRLYLDTSPTASETTITSSCPAWEIGIISTSIDLPAGTDCTVFLVSPSAPVDVLIGLPPLAHQTRLRFVRVDASAQRMRVGPRSGALLNNGTGDLGIVPTGYFEVLGTLLPGVAGWWVIDSGRGSVAGSSIGADGAGNTVLITEGTYTITEADEGKLLVVANGGTAPIDIYLTDVFSGPNCELCNLRITLLRNACHPPADVTVHAPNGQTVNGFKEFPLHQGASFMLRTSDTSANGWYVEGAHYARAPCQ